MPARFRFSPSLCVAARLDYSRAPGRALLPADRYRTDRSLACITFVQLESAYLTGRRTLALRQSRTV